jgi:D-alanyl-lipoteichoic acid acyltransferase DltB (MBOAT superfamily)
MNITALSFFGLAAAFILLYWALPSRFRPAWLLAGSLAFLATWSWQFILVLLAIGAVNFFLGKALATGRRPALLWTGILFNILALLLLKYNDFYAPALTTLLERIGISTAPGGIQLLVPVGLSFLAVQFIGTLIDIYNKRTPPETDPLAFAVYVFYFPKLLSGPIERARDFFARLNDPQKPSGELLARNFALLLVGLVRKIFLADSLNALLPNDLFSAPGNYPMPLLAAWLLAFAFALYNDFAGYTSIVRGISGLLGIQLTNNFRTPYFSRNFNEFWTRWHISLSNWLRDYIFFPLSRSLLRKVPSRSHLVHILVPPLITMLVSGLWHGLSWNMLAWGGLHGLYLVVERIFSLKSRRAPDELPKWRQVLSALLVFACVLLAWIPFSMNLAAAGQYIQALVSPANWQLWDFRFALTQFLAGATTDRWMPWLFPFVQAAFFLVPALLLDGIQYRDELAFLKWPRWLLAILLALTGILFILLSLSDTSVPFVYQGF